MQDEVRSLSAFFPTRAAADAARDEVVGAGVSAEAVSVMDARGTVTGNAAAAPREGTGLVDTIKHAFKQDDHSYDEELGRQGFVLTAHVPAAHAAQVSDILRKGGELNDGP